MFKWEQAAQNWVDQARYILTDNDQPTDYATLSKLNTLPNDRLVYLAIQVVFAHHFLVEELSKQRVNHALDRFYTMVTACEEMEFLRNVPDLENKVIITPRFYKDQSKGIKSTRGSYKGVDTSKREANRTSEQIKLEIKKLHKQKPYLNITAARKEIAKQLDCGFSKVQNSTADWKTYW